jgi:spore coat polysaccharide biosynthesis protein SpsF
MPRLIATIEARMTSTRLPGKVLSLAAGKPMLELMVERLRFVRELDQIVIATTINRTDDVIEALARELGVGVWRGSEDDVLSRVMEAAKTHRADILVQLTGDCPLIDPRIVSRVIAEYRRAGADYVSNVLMRSYPIGMDTQVYAAAILEDVARRADEPRYHEHPSLYIYKHPQAYSLANVLAPPAETRPEMRLTLDTPEDLEVIRAIFAALRPRALDFPLSDMLAFLDAHPEIAAINAKVKHRYV